MYIVFICTHSSTLVTKCTAKVQVWFEICKFSVLKVVKGWWISPTTPSVRWGLANPLALEVVFRYIDPVHNQCADGCQSTLNIAHCACAALHEDAESKTPTLFGNALLVAVCAQYVARTDIAHKDVQVGLDYLKVVNQPIKVLEQVLIVATAHLLDTSHIVLAIGIVMCRHLTEGLADWCEVADGGVDCAPLLIAVAAPSTNAIEVLASLFHLDDFGFHRRHRVGFFGIVFLVSLALIRLKLLAVLLEGHSDHLAVDFHSDFTLVAAHLSHIIKSLCHNIII